MLLTMSTMDVNANVVEMEHTKALENQCRVLAKHVCSQYTHQLKTVFGVVVEGEDPSAHPTHFCHQCWFVFHKTLSTGEESSSTW